MKYLIAKGYEKKEEKICSILYNTRIQRKPSPSNTKNFPNDDELLLKPLDEVRFNKERIHEGLY